MAVFVLVLSKLYVLVIYPEMQPTLKRIEIPLGLIPKSNSLRQQLTNFMNQLSRAPILMVPYSYAMIPYII